ncbi:MAG TPA: DUF4340 domain-containing protein [Vicinamibacterales bacterium]|nr:DUF4340 domain-containing protein [Vicinamibacterales bacterium]
MRGRSTLILLVLAAAFGAYLYFVESKKTVADENAKKKVFTYESSKIEQVEIKLASGEDTALKKDAGGWTIVKPVTAPADQNNVNDIVTNLATLEEDRVVDENASDLKTYGLAQPRMDVTFAIAGEKEPKRILFGDKNPTGVGVYAKLPNANRVFLVGTSADTTFNRTAFDLRDKTALKIQQQDVNSLELISKNQTIRLEKNGEDWKMVKPVEAPADYVSVQGVLGQLQAAQMQTLKDKPEDLKDLKQYGLDKPEVTAIIGAGKQTVTFQLGKSVDAASFWARDAAKPAVFTVANGLAEELRKKPFDFRRKEIFAFRPFNATHFEITRGKDTRAFDRVKSKEPNGSDTWKQVAPAEKAVDASNFEGALLEFSNLRADAAVDKVDPAMGLNPPAAVISVKFDDGKKEERVTIGQRGPDVYAVRPDQPGAMKLELGKYDAAIKKLDSIQ